MTDSRKKKSSRTGTQQTNTYYYVLGQPLRIVKRTNPITQDDPNKQLGNVIAGGRRSTDKVSLDLYLLWAALSSRQKDITILVCRGFTNEQIALRSNLSVSTVKSYLQYVFRKADVHNKAELRLKFVDFDFDISSHI